MNPNLGAVEIVILTVLLFAVPAALLYCIERFENWLRRVAPALFSLALAGLRPLHILALLAAVVGCWLSWTNRAEWETWQLVVPPFLLVAIVYAAPIIGVLFANPVSVAQLGLSALQRAYRRRK